MPPFDTRTPEMKPNMRYCFCLIWLWIALAASPAFATGTQTGIPLDFSSDSVSFDPTTGGILLEGNVQIKRQEMTLSADRILYFQKEERIAADGHILFITEENRMEGNRLEYDMKQKKGVIIDGSLFVSESGFRVRGRRIEKTGEQTYIAEDARITTCDGTRPDWSITASRLDVTVEGFGTLQHGAFRVKNVPLLYAPWAVFPVKIRRQTGLLPPEIHVSDDYGFEQVQPFYLAINDQSDATFYYHFMEKGRDRYGLEYRRIASPEDRLTFMADGLDDNSRPQADATDAGRWDDDDRYWVRFKQNTTLPYGFNGFLDLDVVSDIEYFDDFSGGKMGFSATESTFQSQFGRGLDPEEEKTRTNRFLAAKTGDGWRLETEFAWEDNVRKRSLKETDTTLHRLPELRFSTSRKKIAGLSLYNDVDASLAYFHRIEGERGTRLDLAPRIYAPFRIGNFLSVEPSAGIRETLWYAENTLDTEQNGTENHFRHLYDAKLDLSTEFYRVFQTHALGTEKIKHTLRPQVTFAYVPEEDQEDLPSFDDLDRIANERKFTYSLTQTLTARFAGTPTAENEPALPRYREVMRFKLWQSYDMDKAEEKGEKAFSEVNAEISAYPMEGVRLFGDTEWSTKNAEWSAYSAGFDITTNRSDRFFLEHRYQKDNTASLRLTGQIRASERWHLLWDYERNMKTNTDLRHRYGIRHLSGCWAVDLLYMDDEDDRKIGFFWTLKGLGQFEHSAGEDIIP